MAFSEQEYWSGLPCNLRIEPASPGLLHCRRILYLLSHNGSPTDSVPTKKVTCLRSIHPEDSPDTVLDIITLLLGFYSKVKISESMFVYFVCYLNGTLEWVIVACTQFAIFWLGDQLAFLEVRWGEVTQSCPTLCNPVDCNLLGFSVHGILQARILEWIAISFSRGSSQPRDRTWISRIGGRHFNLWATGEALS